MARLAGVNLQENKRIEIALTDIYGIGRKNVVKILEQARIEGKKKTKDLTSEDIVHLQKILETIPTEGVLRKINSENIQRLKQIGSYRGLRHQNRLPARGQRTRSNARTKRGKRITIGAMKKEILQKMETGNKEKEK